MGPGKSSATIKQAARGGKNCLGRLGTKQAGPAVFFFDWNIALAADGTADSAKKVWNYLKLTWKSTTYISTFWVILESFPTLVLGFRSGAKTAGPVKSPHGPAFCQPNPALERFIPANLHTIMWDCK